MSQPIFSSHQIKFIMGSLLCMMPVIGMAVDVITPSLPAMAEGLQVSQGVVQTTIGLYLVGYAFGNFFTGILADAWGRHKLLHGGMLGFIIMSLLPFLFPRLEVVLVVRVIQGLATGCVATAIRAIFADILSPEKIVRMGTLIGAMWGVGPIIGPVIGGYLQFYFNWPSIFLFLTLASLLIYIPIFFFVPETHFHRHPLHIRTIGKHLREILSHKWFVGLSLIMACAYALIISFHTLGPFLIESTLHYSPIFFGHFALWMGSFLLVGTLLSRYLLKKYSGEKLQFVLIHFFFLVAILGFFASFIVKESLFLTALMSASMFFCTGSLFSMSMGMGLSRFKHIAGTATAIMYLLNTLITSLASFAISFMNTHTVSALMLVYVALLLVCLVTYWYTIR